ncbi:GatB/YqeY domain-containing protein [Candidatus Nomurabacteria bacterium]|nr:GatB/YqeY domain-containing protein [Candidatus Nomurabacteria bacterium]
MIERISTDIKNAMRSGDKERLMVLRSLKTDIKNREIELIRQLEEPEVMEMIQKAIKSRAQALEMYRQGEREDLAAIEEREIEISKEYLPTELTPDEVSLAVREAIAHLEAASMKDMGKVIGYVKEKYGLRVDGKILSTVVKQELT